MKWAKKYFNGSHWLYFCPQCSPGQRCAISGHREGIYRCPPAAGLPCGCSGSPRARSAAVARICMAAPKRRSAAGGGAARRSRWPGVQTAGAASTGATRAAPAWHANVAFAPRRTRQHAWNLHQHCTLAQVPLIDLKSILLKNFAKRIYFKITIFFALIN